MASWTCAIQAKGGGRHRCGQQCPSCMIWFPPLGHGSAMDVLAWLDRVEAAEWRAEEARR